MYLHAAWLFLLSRVVYRGLTREGEQDDETEAEISWEREGINISVSHQSWLRSRSAQSNANDPVLISGTISFDTTTMGHIEPISHADCS
jgi:hypothetical protein